MNIEKLRDIRGQTIYYFWKFVHNAIVHPLLSTPFEPKFLTYVHDWTAKHCKGAG